MANENVPVMLTSRQKKYLNGLGHSLSPVILIGKEGISERLIAATNVELSRHELIKVKIGNNSGLEKKETATILAGTTNSVLVQLLGKTILLYRKNPDRPKDEQLVLPQTRLNSPRAIS